MAASHRGTAGGMIERAAATHGCDRFSRDKVLAMMGREPEQFRPMITHLLPLD